MGQLNREETHPALRAPLPGRLLCTHLGPHPLNPPLPKMGEGEARQGFPAPLLPSWEKGLGDEGKALAAKVLELMYTR
ncbi:MAG: hypothetical protein EA342_00550 [Leptolyngbya sp. LCM1.Bin17]|nr:MAG: hypothetical protein EA342_00550 [Leptolyngbya sp. LCM1.Bin17]